MRQPHDDYDGFVQYDSQPDFFDHRRASRVRFAAANLPILLLAWVVAALLLWLA